MTSIMEIESPKNPIIKSVKNLKKKKNRYLEGKFIVEGIKIIEEAIDEKIPMDYIIYEDKLLATQEGLSLLEKSKNIKKIRVSQRVFKELSDTENPQGVLAVVEFKLVDIDLLEVNKRENIFLVYLDGIQDPGNMGTIIRSADAFNIDGIILGPGCVDPYNLKVVRATMGSIFRTKIYSSSDPLGFFNKAKKQGINILATSLEGEELDTGILAGRSICIIGNEGSGVGQDILRLSNKAIKIPMPGRAESLNAGVATSIIMYESMKYRK